MRRLGLAAAALLVAACGGGDGAHSSSSAPSLEEPTVLAAGGASNPTVAVAPDGGAWVAWVSDHGAASDVFVARREEGGGWSAPVRVNDVPGDAAPHLQAPAAVAAGDGGRVWVAWQNNTLIDGRPYPASDLRLARSVDGGRTFEPAVTVNDDAGGPPASHTFHDVLLTPAGDVVVSWLDGRDEVSTVRVAVSADGGRTFGPARVVDREPCPCCRTALTAARDGSLLVAWRKVLPGSVRDIVVARSRDGGATWSGPARVHDDGWVFEGCPHAGPSLAVAGDGALHAAWYTGREGGAGLYHARRPADGEFGPATPLTGVAPPSQTSLTVDGSGRAWLAWEERGADGHAIRLAALDREGTPPPTAVVVGGNPSLAGDARGVVMAWLAGDSVLVAAASPPP